jgi:hypothetical protein
VIVTNVTRGEISLSLYDSDHQARSLSGRSIPSGIAFQVLILLVAWNFSSENMLPAIALAILTLALAAFCPEPR